MFIKRKFDLKMTHSWNCGNTILLWTEIILFLYSKACHPLTQHRNKSVCILVRLCGSSHGHHGEVLLKIVMTTQAIDSHVANPKHVTVSYASTPFTHMPMHSLAHTYSQQRHLHKQQRIGQNWNVCQSSVLFTLLWLIELKWGPVLTPFSFNMWSLVKL